MQTTATAKVGNAPDLLSGILSVQVRNEEIITEQGPVYQTYVDAVIEPQDTRKYVIGAFEMLFTKREGRPDKKHGTV